MTEIEQLKEEIQKLREEITKLKLEPKIEYHYHTHYPQPEYVPRVVPFQPCIPPYTTWYGNISCDGTITQFEAPARIS